jgi:Na+-transporting methylmalonyl-CoA/oxaloacetate decarboxylase gamma subunit
MTPLVQSLWITLIGMALVSLVIAILWALIEGLMRLTARFATVEGTEGEEQTDQVTALAEPAPAVVSEQKKRAAAAAVAIALALQKPVGNLIPAQSRGSAWHAVTRANQLNQPTHITRKTRGSVR